MAFCVRKHPDPEPDRPFTAQSVDDDGRRLFGFAQGRVQCVDCC
jgi:hypothetical protein